jgi:NAD(P)H-dependent FMN reductase
MDKLKIPILLGTNRKDRNSEHVANWLLQVVQKREDIETIMEPTSRIYSRTGAIVLLLLMV